jgi:hypothetical protein
LFGGVHIVNNFCPECSAENLEEAKFCQECGNKLHLNDETNLNENLNHHSRIKRFDTYNIKSTLKKHMKNRLGTDLRPSDEVKSFFGAGSLPSFNRQKAAMFTTSTNIEIEKRIESGEIKTVEEIDHFIDGAFKKRKARIEKARIDKEIESSKPVYKVIHYPKAIVKKYQKTSDFDKLRRTGNVIGGGFLLGPVGALAGYALSDPPKTETKTKVIKKKYTQKSCFIQIYENKFEYSNKKATWSVLYEKISSMHLNKNINTFEVFENNGSKLVFLGGKNTNPEYTEQVFNEVKSRFKEYKIKTNPKKYPNLFKNQKSSPLNFSKN